MRKILTFGFFIFQFLAIGQPVQWTTGPGANNHFYEAMYAPSGISWEAAEAIAESRGGYLATLTTPEENLFVFNLINNPIYWINDQAGNSDAFESP